MDTQIFVPVGGMNQDDSALTPTPNYEGRNAFALGDYKYLQNARIRSSNSDHFGDVETIKGTTKVVPFFARAQRFDNPQFLDGLDKWSQTGDQLWANSIDDEYAQVPAGCDDILYQGITLSNPQKNRTLAVRVNTSEWTSANYNSFTSATLYLVYMNGTSVISKEALWSIGEPMFVYRSITLPDNCDNIGFQCISTYTGTQPKFSMQWANIFHWGEEEQPEEADLKVVGKLSNDEHNRIYYCIWSSSGYHELRYYDGDTDAVYRILSSQLWNFQKDGFVSMAMIDNWMAMTDRHNAPRLFDVNYLADLPLMIGSANMREFHIAMHRWAPVRPPLVRARYHSSTDNTTRFLNRNIQFAYRYVYVGNIMSRWSPISAPMVVNSISGTNKITDVEIHIPGFLLDIPGANTSYNYFNHSDIKFHSVVQYIDIAYREGVNDIWKLLTRREVASSGNNSYVYDGDVADDSPIPEDDFYQLFDAVPLKAGVVAVADNRFVFFDILEEYELGPRLIITDTGFVSYTQTSLSSSVWTYGSDNASAAESVFSGMSAGDAAILSDLNRINRQGFKGRGIYKLGVQWIAANGWRSAVETSDDLIIEVPASVNVIESVYGFTFKIHPALQPPEWAVAYQIVRTNCLNIDYFMFGLANSFTPLIDDAPDGDFDDKVKSPTEIINRVRTHFENIRLAIGDKFDEYEYGAYLKSFYRSLVADVRSTQDGSSIEKSSRIYIDVNNWYNSSVSNNDKTENNPMNELFYNFREGDRVRFLASTSATPASMSELQIFDEEILEFTGRGIIVKKPADVKWLPKYEDWSPATTASVFAIEVYTPKKVKTADDHIYYECGEWYPVLYPGTAQRALSRKDWTFTNNASITCTTYGLADGVKVFEKKPFNAGDCSRVPKRVHLDYESGVSILYLDMNTSAMNHNPSRTYDVWERGNGRASVALSIKPQVRFIPTKARFGGSLIEESLVNNINRFKEEDQKVFPSEYGRIRFVASVSNQQVDSVGMILLAIGEKETFSIYVNRTTLEDLSGRTQVMLSDKLLGSYNTLLGSHGTRNPESVSQHRGRVYFWDSLDGAWIRYGRDGLTAISDYKMRSWFKGIGRLLTSYYNGDEKPVVVSGFDPLHDELVTYINHSALPSTYRDYSTYKGAAFSETAKRWEYVHDLTPEMMESLNDQFFSFKGGEIFKHDTNSNMLTFYGVKHDARIEPVFSGMPMDMKSWGAIAIVSSHKWSAERMISEYRGAKTKQVSSLLLDDFKEREDAYYANILMDTNTPIVSDPIINGERMRSRSLSVLLKLDPAITDLSLLYYVSVVPQDSPRNP